jgi:cytochrome c-type biogenesis protein
MQELFGALGNAVNGAPWLALGAAVLWGVLSLLLSPCHLASIPLVVAFIGRQGGVTTMRASGIAGMFALGILLTIALVGAATAAAGRMLGDVGGAGNYLVALIFFVMGLHLLEVLPLPWQGAAPAGPRRGGWRGALLLGLVFGLALGPCTFAFMAPLLGVVFKFAATRPWYVMALLVGYAVGHCSIIVLAGTCTSLVQRQLDWHANSRTGGHLRRACGGLMLLGGLWLIFTA